MAVATLALGAGSAVANYSAQRSAAKQSAVFQNKRYAETAVNANDAYLKGLNQLFIRDSQETEAASRDAITARRTVGGQKASAATLVKSAGLSGNSVNALLAEFDRLDADNQLVIDTNLRMTQNQIKANMEGLRANAQNQINGVTPQPVNQPSTLGLLLGVGSAGLDAATTWKTFSK